MSKKAWIIFASVCVVLLAGLVVLSGKDKVDVSGIDQSKIQAPSAQSGNIGDHVFGKADSKVKLIEYGDYQCPGCGSAYPVLKAVTDKYKDQMTFIFRNLPLSSLHPNARAAAAAAEAAGLQGKFWEMHDQLYGNQSDWENDSVDQRLSTFTDYAKNLGLKTDQFKTDFAGKQVSQKIAFDEALFSKTNLPKSTPTILLNGKQVDTSTWSDQSKMDQAVADALKTQGIALPGETKKK